jgi:penicillin-binding protein 1A
MNDEYRDAPATRLPDRLSEWYAQRHSLRLFQMGLPAATALLVALFVGTLYVFSLSPELPELRRGHAPEVPLASIAYSEDGVELARYYHENRDWISLDEVSPAVLDALLATEDRRFYDHSGVDWRRLFSASWRTAGGDRQGGSTLTMQLARNLFEEVGRSITVERKLREILAARKIERHYSKDEILEAYLNTVPFNHLAFGIEAASQTYFNMSAADIGPLEAATLVGMLKGPTRYNPVSNPDLSEYRRNTVLAQMVEFRRLSQADFERLRALPIELDFHQMTVSESDAPYFAEHVRLWAAEWARQNGYDLYRDGLRIHTTLNMEMQRAAQEAVDRQMEGLQAVVDYEWATSNPRYLANNTDAYVSAQDQGGFVPFAHLWATRPELVNDHIRRTEAYRVGVRSGRAPAEVIDALQSDEEFMDSLRRSITQLQVGFVGMDPANGYVRVWVGGRDFDSDRYDKVANSRRQPGSTFKPFVYGAAIEAGYSPHYAILDQLRTISVPGTGEAWTPRNANHSYTGGYMTMRTGLAQSVNTVTAQLAMQVTPRRVAEFAQKTGISSPLLPVPALALGTSEVTLLEMTAAYTTFAAMGKKRDPIVVTHIEDRHGNLLATFRPVDEQSISAFTAYTMVDMLRDAVDRGTGQRMRWYFGVEGDLAGKTGTTQERADGWFMAMHPDLVTGAWVGFNDRRIAIRTSWWGQGARTGLYVTGDFFRAAQQRELLSKEKRFTEPEGMDDRVHRYHAAPQQRRGPSPDGYRVNRQLYEALTRTSSN